jgi:signal transduction histidine kinase
MADGRGWLALACGRDGTISRVLRDDFGVARAGARLADIVDSESAQKARNFVASLGANECAVDWRLNVLAAGAPHPLRFSCAALGDQLLIFASGPAERDDHTIYDELSRLNNELINRERELARKSAALERVSAEKSRVVAIAAHDLRNPLTVIASYADLLKLDASTENAYLEEIRRSARFMMELVEEMLDASRVESGRLDLDLEDVDLVDAARHSATINRLRAERKEITIDFESEVERALIRADRVKLRQILSNLMVNAIKFSPSRTTVTVRVRIDRNRAVVEVEDRGIGIAAEKIPTIFEPFHTLGPTGTAGERSTGLGLSIVKQLADLHGAEIEVESEKERGSSFRVAFRLNASTP